MDRSTDDLDAMFAVLGIGGEQGNSVEIAYLRDTRYDPLNFRGRDPKSKNDAVVLKRVTMGQTFSFSVSPVSQDAYPNSRELLSSVKLDRCPTNRCGKVFDRVSTYLSCGSCPAGKTCQQTHCVKGTSACTPKKTVEACAADSKGRVPCGLHGDGCGGLVECGKTCPAGQTCGGGDRPLFCGDNNMTVKRLRALYRDTGDQLCGVFQHGDERLDLSADNRKTYGRDCPVQGDVCRNNLCARPNPSAKKS